jgi:hypothetical protein
MAKMKLQQLLTLCIHQPLCSYLEQTKAWSHSLYLRNEVLKHPIGLHHDQK